MEKILTIALDGPAGSGKSTIAKALGDRLNILFLSTGAIYRAFGLKCQRLELDPKVEESAKKVVNSKVEIKYLNREQVVFLDGENVNGLIYNEVIGSFASFISQHKIIRERCVEIQREIAAKQSMIVDGRDIGSVVLPKANFKFYLDADVKVRAERRFKDLVLKNPNLTLKEVEDDLRERDYQDTHRKLSPLVECEDAIRIDSTNMTVDEVINKFIEIIESKK